MEALRGFYELVRETYGPFFPISKTKKEAFLEKARNKVACYKPKMEEACNVDMGEVHVKDFKYWAGDFFRDRLQDEYREYAEREGHEPSKFARGMLASPILTARAIAEPLLWLFMSSWGAEMKHYNSSIYIPFYFQNRVMDMDFKRMEKRLDQSIVHELSHNLWYCLGGNKTADSRRDWKLWNEGFAYYCADIHFADLYPEDFEVKRTKGSGIRRRGKEKVGELVAKYGEKILLEVPKRWTEFNNNS
ncbi:MAG: hypothetical protein HZB66_01535 [Candidatus Aenigmarchaeota archaeon]|nr:hypothetical protein [Candidatus Aenigmarchaeota archaeon]